MAAKPNKTQATALSVDDFLAGVEPQARRADAETFCALMARVTGEPATMWGPSIIGFGVHRYRYDSGREGEVCKLGFAPRKPATVFYGLGAATHADEVAALGKVSTGKGCVYVKSRNDIDLGRLEALIARAWKG